MRGNRARNTSPEVALRSTLHRRGLRFFTHRRPLPGLRCEADLVFPRLRLAVFVDGCFWHGCKVHKRPPKANRAYWVAKIERNVERDREQDRNLREAGWTVVRVWEHESLDEGAERVIAAVKSLQPHPPC